MPIAPSGAWAINDPKPSHSVLGCSCHSGPVGPLLFQLCFSVSPPTVARPASLPLPLRVPGQGLACGAGCWLPEGVPDAAPLPPQYLLGPWFLSRSLPQIFISDLLLPLDFVDVISGDNRKISVLMGTLLHVVGSCTCHSELTEEMEILLRPTPREDSSALTFL